MNDLLIIIELFLKNVQNVQFWMQIIQKVICQKHTTFQEILFWNYMSHKGFFSILPEFALAGGIEFYHLQQQERDTGLKDAN